MKLSSTPPSLGEFSLFMLTDPDPFHVRSCQSQRSTGCQSWLQDFSHQNSSYRAFTEKCSCCCHQRLTTWSTLRTSWQASWLCLMWHWYSGAEVAQGELISKWKISLGFWLAPARVCMCVWTHRQEERLLWSGSFQKPHAWSLWIDQTIVNIWKFRIIV